MILTIMNKLLLALIVIHLCCNILGYFQPSVNPYVNLVYSIIYLPFAIWEFVFLYMSNDVHPSGSY